MGRRKNHKHSAKNKTSSSLQFKSDHLHPKHNNNHFSQTPSLVQTLSGQKQKEIPRFEQQEAKQLIAPLKINPNCPICEKPAKNWAIGKCPHLACADCSHRLRVLHNNNSCPTCSAYHEQIVVVPAHLYQQDMDFDKARALPGLIYDNDVNMWFKDSSFQVQLKNLRACTCSHPLCSHDGEQNTVFRNYWLLKAHAKKEHQAEYCDACLTSRRFFLSELGLFPLHFQEKSSSARQSHISKVHPKCKLCVHQFLDQDDSFAKVLKTPKSFTERKCETYTHEKDTRLPIVDKLQVGENGIAPACLEDDGRFHPLPVPHSPDEIQKRSAVLLRWTKKSLHPASYELFRRQTETFHGENISAEIYFEYAIEAFGFRSSIRFVLPELIALIPKPYLRDQLLQVCLRETNTMLNPAEILEASGGISDSTIQAEAYEKHFPTLS